MVMWWIIRGVRNRGGGVRLFQNRQEHLGSEQIYKLIFMNMLPVSHNVTLGDSSPERWRGTIDFVVTGFGDSSRSQPWPHIRIAWRTMTKHSTQVWLTSPRLNSGIETILMFNQSWELPTIFVVKNNYAGGLKRHHFKMYNSVGLI